MTEPASGSSVIGTRLVSRYLNDYRAVELDRRRLEMGLPLTWPHGKVSREDFGKIALQAEKQCDYSRWCGKEHAWVGNWVSLGWGE